jgi:hypothetical protein
LGEGVRQIGFPHLMPAVLIREGEISRKGLLATLSGALARHEELFGRKAHTMSLGCARDDKAKRSASRDGWLLE